jgi:hypothetical protein
MVMAFLLIVLFVVVLPFLDVLVLLTTALTAQPSSVVARARESPVFFSLLSWLP